MFTRASSASLEASPPQNCANLHGEPAVGKNAHSFRRLRTSRERWDFARSATSIPLDGVTHSSLYAVCTRMDLIRTLIRGGGHDTVEPPRAAPRVAEPASLTRLWRKADGDVADHVVSFLPTKCLAVLPTLADSFRRDQWRMLGVMMRRQGAAAGGTRAILGTLQVLGRELAHYREDWSDQADLIPQRWRGCKGGRGAPADVEVDHRVGISSNTTNPALIIERTTPHNSVFIGVVNTDLGVPDRCCMQRFRVSLRYSGNHEGTCLLYTSPSPRD